ncbi:MAG: transporter [Gammaproteobacteria bacterium]|nr:transporter [Gammaproteobacteria bacterium]
MLGYSYMDMSMEGNRDGTKVQSVADILNAGFLVAPTAMTMKMHMLEIMYGLTDDITLMAMLPHERISMDHVNGAGSRFTTNASGVGDLSLSAIYGAFQRGQHRIDVTAGISVPTGSIDQTDGTPLGPDQQLPYPMQLGSGTYDPVVGATYLNTGVNWSWGTHVQHTFRLGDNSRDYTLGDRTHLDVWLARQWAERFAITGRLNGRVWGNIEGADPALNPGMVPTADPTRRGGKTIDIAVGASFYAHTGALAGSRLVVEFAYPAYMSLDGPQLASDARLSLGLQWIF